MQQIKAIFFQNDCKTRVAKEKGNKKEKGHYDGAIKRRLINNFQYSHNLITGRPITGNVLILDFKMVNV